MGRSNTGDYDQSILCRECDQFLGNFDDYGKQVLLDDVLQQKNLRADSEVLASELQGCDAEQLQKFVLAVLWRASITSRPFFARVKLGPYDEKLRAYLWEDPTHKKSFGVVLSKFSPSKRVEGLEKTIQNPFRSKIDSRNYYRLYFGGYCAWVRVDSRPGVGVMGAFEILRTPKPVIIQRSFDTSKELELLNKVRFRLKR